MTTTTTAFPELIAYLTSPTVQRPLFPLEVVCIIVSILLFIAIFYLLKKLGGLMAEQRKTANEFFGYKDVAKTVDSKIQKSWQAINGLLKNDLEAEYKIAIIDADALFSQILAKMGWNADSLTGQLNLIMPGQDSPFNEVVLRRLADLRNVIVCDKNYKLDMVSAKQLFADLEKELKRLDK